MGFHHLSSADYSVLATTKDKAITECNMKAISLYRSLLCKLLYKQLILMAPRRYTGHLSVLKTLNAKL